ncbi:MAG: conjugative transfer signal peptidase TraF [Nitrosospira sp.]
MVKLTGLGRALVIGGVGFLVLGLLCFAVGFRVNTTRSIPVGLYLLTDTPVTKNKYVIFCPPKTSLFDEAQHRGYIGAGFCPGGYGLMMKRVLAAGNDRVEMTREGISINGTPVPSSISLGADKAGRAMPQYPPGTYILGKSELLLMSDASNTSFDSRYFGPIDASQVLNVIRPVITW